MAEQVVADYTGPAAVVRICLSYGDAIGPSSSFLGWLVGTLEKGSPLTLFEDEWRTPLFVGDICRSLARFIENSDRSPEAPFQIIHLAGPERLSRYEMGLAVANAYQLDASLIKKTSRLDFEGMFRAHDVSLSSAMTA